MTGSLDEPTDIGLDVSYGNAGGIDDSIAMTLSPLHAMGRLSGQNKTPFAAPALEDLASRNNQWHVAALPPTSGSGAQW
eukprot:CAMPEP_0182558738 /NCGR_PEP_ID=MMETSP1324-20130603/2130_1 /TAXON_ID=236786 /ORGANISM="Florenciella sp., Strain RCC1587" /LENGTH=78 /DNA_ID=CAMNT_0024770931 /DNA_START=27 /DNA_END=261 /DNA_ORIENTATION=-